MPSDLEGYLCVVPPGSTAFVPAGRVSQSCDRLVQAVGTFIDGHCDR
jgi:hypothetical protein